MVKTKKDSMSKILIKNIIGIVLFFIIIFFLSGFLNNDAKEDKSITLTELVNDINAEKIASIKNINEKIEVTYKDDTVKQRRSIIIN